MQQLILPKKLYKYRKFDPFSVQILAGPTTYYSSPIHFNDPLDCDPTIDLDVDTVRLHALCHHFMVSSGMLQEHEASASISRFREESQYPYMDEDREPTADEIEEYFRVSLSNEVKALLDAEFRKEGVLSLAETWDCPLMWSHYADGHRGICIEYDTLDLPHPRLAPVDYSGRRSIKASDLAAWKLDARSQARENIRQSYFFCKASQWEYEREWRDLSERNGQLDEGYRISSVYFGLRCEFAVTTIVVKLFSGQADIEFYDIYPLGNTFKLRRRAINRSEVEACGLRGSARLDFKNVVLPQLSD
jgi:hypothetical protein